MRIVRIVPIVYFVCKETEATPNIYRNIRPLLISLRFFCEQSGYSRCVFDFSVGNRGRDKTIEIEHVSVTLNISYSFYRDVCALMTICRNYSTINIREILSSSENSAMIIVHRHAKELNPKKTIDDRCWTIWQDKCLSILASLYS
jgi:hypothetical protein